MLKVKVDKGQVLCAVIYHATDSMGLTPFINGDADLVEWLALVADDIGEIAEGVEMIAVVDGDYVIIGGDKSVIEFVKSHITY